MSYTESTAGSDDVIIKSSDGEVLEIISKAEFNKRREDKRKADPNLVYDVEGRLLPDGIYDVTQLDVINFEEDKVGGWHQAVKHDDTPEIVEFKKKYPKYVVAQAYQATTIFFLSQMPENISKMVQAVGEGFSYGSCNLLKNCPKDILILAEDD